MKRLIIGLAGLVAVAFGSTTEAAIEQWEFRPITDNSRHDVDPSTDGTHVVWTGYRYDGDYDVCLV